MSRPDPMSAGAYYEFMGFDRGLLLERYAPYVDLFAGASEVLDLGCGTGAFLELLGRAGISAHGVDADPDQVRHCTERGLSAEVADAMAHLAENPERYSGLFCAHVVEHLTGEQVSALAVAAHKALKPGGSAVFVTPNPKALHVHLQEFWRDPTHVRMYSEEALSFLLARAGFSVTSAGDNKRFMGGIGRLWEGADQGPGMKLLTRLLVRSDSFKRALGLDQGNELYVATRK